MSHGHRRTQSQAHPVLSLRVLSTDHVLREAERLCPSADPSTPQRCLTQRPACSPTQERKLHEHGENPGAGKQLSPQAEPGAAERASSGRCAADTDSPTAEGAGSALLAPPRTAEGLCRKATPQNGSVLFTLSPHRTHSSAPCGAARALAAARSTSSRPAAARRKPALSGGTDGRAASCLNLQTRKKLPSPSAPAVLNSAPPLLPTTAHRNPAVDQALHGEPKQMWEHSPAGRARSPRSPLLISRTRRTVLREQPRAEMAPCRELLTQAPTGTHCKQPGSETLNRTTSP